MHIPTRAAVIIGSYINACSIAKAIQSLQQDVLIWIVDTEIDEDEVCLADVAAPKVSVIKKKISSAREMISFLNQSIPQEYEKTILFTDEEWIDAVGEAIRSGQLVNATAHLGAAIGNEVIFDRFKFYQFVNQLHCISTPKTIDFSEDPFSILGETFVFRFKKSWLGSRKLPRLTIIHGKAEFEREKGQYLKEGIPSEAWCYQELLSTSDQHNVSVCGWHDEEYQQYAVTRKVVQHPPKTGTGDVVEVLRDFPPELVNATHTILSAMKYAGPFEMEFVYDNQEKIFKIIELNPRFWMQHQLVSKVTGDSLIKRALGFPVPQAIPPEKLSARYWVNGNQMLYRLAKLQFKVIPYALKGDWYPKPAESIRWFFHYKKYKKNTKTATTLQTTASDAINGGNRL